MATQVAEDMPFICNRTKCKKHSDKKRKRRRRKEKQIASGQVEFASFNYVIMTFSTNNNYFELLKTPAVCVFCIHTT